MQSPTDQAGIIGVEAYGAGFQASDDSPHAVECEVVDDGGAPAVWPRTAPGVSPSSTAPYAPRRG